MLYEDSVNKAENRPERLQSSSSEIYFNRKFCNFLVSNGVGSEFRTSFFKKLSTIRKVDSGGRYLNNIGHLVGDKYQWQKEYKFSLCFENSSTSGYLTEKLIEGYAADTVPVYWGDPDAFGSIHALKGGINPKAVIFIDENNVEAGIRHILDVDADRDLYAAYLKEPLFLDHNHSAVFRRRLEGFLKNIVVQSKEQAYRRGFGLARMRIENRNRARSSRYKSLVRYLKKRLKL